MKRNDTRQRSAHIRKLDALFFHLGIQIVQKTQRCIGREQRLNIVLCGIVLNKLVSVIAFAIGRKTVFNFMDVIGIQRVVPR